MEKLPERIRKIRKEHGLSQQKLASDLGVSRSTIAGYETNKRKPDNETLSNLADYFNVSVDYLLGRTDQRQSNSVLINEIKSEEDKKIEMIRQAVSDDPELLEMWDSVSARDDLVMLFKQTRDLPPAAIKSIIQFIKAIEDEESN